MKKKDLISVTEAKIHLLEIIRQAQRGRRYKIMKHGKVVAEIGPSRDEVSTPLFGFAKETLVDTKEITEPIKEDWSFDSDKFGSKKKKSRPKS